jgi:hypothetical protein
MKLNVEKAIERAKRAHEKRRVEYFKKNKYDIGEFKGLEIPWRPRLGVFKGCNSKAIFYPETMQATSYGHWVFVKPIKGKLVFNWYTYSPTTTGHQYAVSRLLKELGIKVDVEVYMHESLDRFEGCALEPVYREICELEASLANPRVPERCKRSHKKRIKSLQKQIVTLKKLGAKSPGNLKAMIKEAIEVEKRRQVLMLEAAAQRRAMKKQAAIETVFEL